METVVSYRANTEGARWTKSVTTKIDEDIPKRQIHNSIGPPFLIAMRNSESAKSMNAMAAISTPR